MTLPVSSAADDVALRSASVPLVEVACAFGEQCALVGVYTPAQQATARPGGRVDRNETSENTNDAGHSDQAPLCVLYLTAGLLHHIGPHRLHVEMARELASAGVAGLRFDLSGVGDSEASVEAALQDSDDTPRSVAEVQQAMDYIQTCYGHRRFVLLGLCSGADDALLTAIDDPRVVGCVLLNAWAYRAGFFRLHQLWNFWLPRALVWSKWRNALLRLTRRLVQNRRAINTQSDAGNFADSVSESGTGIELGTGTGTGTGAGADAGAGAGSAKGAGGGAEAEPSDRETAELEQLDRNYRRIPAREQSDRWLSQLANEKTELLFVFTGSEHEVYTYHGQLMAMFPDLAGSAHVSERFFKRADHTLTLRDDRQQLIQWVRQWFADASFERSG